MAEIGEPVRSMTERMAYIRQFGLAFVGAYAGAFLGIQVYFWWATIQCGH